MVGKESSQWAALFFYIKFFFQTPFSEGGVKVMGDYIFSTLIVPKFYKNFMNVVPTMVGRGEGEGGVGGYGWGEGVQSGTVLAKSRAFSLRVQRGWPSV